METAKTTTVFKCSCPVGIAHSQQENGSTCLLVRRGCAIYSSSGTASGTVLVGNFAKELKGSTCYERATLAGHGDRIYVGGKRELHVIVNGVIVQTRDVCVTEEDSASYSIASTVRIRQITYYPRLNQVLVLIADADTGYDHVRVYDKDINYVYSFAYKEMDCYGFQIIADEIYCCLTNADSVEVYSTDSTGQFSYSREINTPNSSQWSQPLAICSMGWEWVGSRLFVVELRHNDNRQEDEDDSDNRGQSIFSMDMKGCNLQKRKFLTGDEFFGGDMVRWNNNILCTTEEWDEDGSVTYRVRSVCFDYNKYQVEENSVYPVQ